MAELTGNIEEHSKNAIETLKERSKNALETLREHRAKFEGIEWKH
jgi:hypothetical protein